MYCLDEFYKAAWTSLSGKTYKEFIPIGFTQDQILALYKSVDTTYINELTTNRFVMGSMRYNATGLKTSPNYDLMKTMQLKLDLYIKDGNQEHLLDLINYCKLEIINKTHPLSHFDAIDDGIHTVQK